MSLEKVPFLSVSTAETLVADIEKNLPRYEEGDFADLLSEGGWDIRLSIEGELDALSTLTTDGGASDDLENSWIVWRSLRSLTPSLATEGRIWARLCHVEGLSYARKRWLVGSGTRLADSVRKHFFAFSLTGWRDDNAISRLWWNAHIASVIFPEDPPSALSLILKRADIRLNFIERPWIATRLPLANGIIHLMLEDPWVLSSESSFRAFIKAVNKLGGGIVFEVLNKNEIRDFLNRCREKAEQETGPKVLEPA